MLDFYLRKLLEGYQQNAPAALGGKGSASAPYGTMPPPSFTTDDTGLSLPSLELLDEATAIQPQAPAVAPTVKQPLPASPVGTQPSNAALIGQQDKMDQIAALSSQLRGGRPMASAYEAANAGELTGQQQGYSTVGPRAPEPVMPSRAAQTGAYGAGAYQSDRNARLAILNEQERNRVPTTALPEHTMNLDKLPAALQEVYAQRDANKAKRDELVMAGKLQPLVAPTIASPEKVAEDKRRRAQDESYRQGNWSMQEQARALSRKLGINPLMATALVSGRMASGEALGANGEPRMPDSWEPRLREGDKSMLDPLMQVAAYGPQGAAFIERQKIENQGATDRLSAQRGGMTPEQMAGLTTAQAMINSGDPAAVQQGIQLARQFLSANSGMAPQQGVAAPGASQGAAHAVANGYQHPDADSVIDSEIANHNLATGPDGMASWDANAVNQFATQAANRLARQLGVSPEAAMGYVKQWYDRKKNSSWFGYGFPSIGSTPPAVGGRRDALTIPAR